MCLRPRTWLDVAKEVPRLIAPVPIKHFGLGFGHVLATLVCITCRGNVVTFAASSSHCLATFICLVCATIACCVHRPSSLYLLMLFVLIAVATSDFVFPWCARRSPVALIGSRSTRLHFWVQSYPLSTVSLASCLGTAPPVIFWERGLGSRYCPYRKKKTGFF